MRKLRQDQRDAIRYLYERDSALLFADVGTGKTVIALTVMQLWRHHGAAHRAIVFAPSRVCTDVWRQEVEEWPHLEETRVVCAAGRPAGQRRDIMENPDVDVVCINYENIPWLMREFPDGVPGVDVLWFDEVDKMKSPTSLRFKGRGRRNSKNHVQGMRDWRGNFPTVVGMTGTPVSNSLLDLWAQVYCVDGGDRLCDTYDLYRRRHFYQSDYAGYSYKVYPDSVPLIHEAIGDITHRIEGGDSLPAVVHTPPRYVDMPPPAAKHYREMERSYITEFDGGDPAVALDAAGAYSKLRQMTAGFVYADDGTTEMHDVKYRELDNLIGELQGAQLLVVFQFRGQEDELRKRYGVRLGVLSGQTKAGEGTGIIEKWNAGELPILAVQPQSAGHGLNLQLSGAHHVCMLTEPESAGMFVQVVGRLARTGQENTVFVHTIHARGTVDEDRAAVVADKRGDLLATLDAIKARQERERA